MSSIPSGRSALQQQRAVLAELFRSGERSIADHTDARVCRLYLCGLCPADLFVNTKYFMAPCMKVHDDALRGQYEAALARGGASYEAELLFQLEELTQRAERRTAADARRAEEEEGPACFVPRVETERTPEVEAATREVEAKEREAEAAVAAGSVSASVALEEALEGLRRKKCLEQARACRVPPAAVPQGRAVHPRLRVCSGCGGQVNLQDADDRTADHFQGRAHLGHVTAAAWCAKLRAARDARKAAAAPPQAPQPQQGGGGSQPAAAGGGSAGPGRY
jgi:RNA-binding protein Luc7-like 2